MIWNLYNLIRNWFRSNATIIVLYQYKENYFKCLRNPLRSLTLLAQESCELGKQNLNTLIFYLYCRLITQYIYNYVCHQNMYTNYR